MSQTALQGLGINYDWTLRADDWKPGMDADLVIINGLLGNRVQAVTDAEPSVGVAPDVTNAGKGWLVGTSPAAWATGKANYIAFRNGSTATWIFIAPSKAYGQILNLATGEFMEYNGTTWVDTFTPMSEAVPATGWFLQALTNTPPTPTSPGDNGKCWGVDSSPTGVWAGKSGKMAMWYVPPGGATGGWKFITPSKGWRALSDAVPFDDTFSAYGYGVCRDFYLHNGSVWEIDPLLRLARGPFTSLDFTAAVAGTQYIRVLTAHEAGSGALLIASAAAGTDIVIRYPQVALPLVPLTQLMAVITGDLSAKIRLEWGDGTETPGAMGNVGSSGLGASAGSAGVNLQPGVADFVNPLTPALGMASSLAQYMEKVGNGIEYTPVTLTFTAGVCDLTVPADMFPSLVVGNGHCSRLIVTDEVLANTLRIASNPTIFNSTVSEVIKFQVAQKGAGATTIVLDNTVTGTNNANDILDAIAPATMSQGESRVIRFVRNGGTGGLGHRWVITHS